MSVTQDGERGCPALGQTKDGRPLRVALVSECYYPDVGGMPEHLHQLGVALCTRGHQVTIVTTSFPDLHRDEAALPLPGGMQVVRLGRSCRPVISNGSVSRAAIGLGVGAALRRTLAAGFDLVHVHGPLFPTLALLAIRHAPAAAALCGTLHTHFEDSLLLRALRRPLQRYLDALDGVVAVSESALRSVRQVGLAVAGEVIPNGVDLAYWRAGRPLRELQDGRVNLLVLARLEPRNDIRLVLAALQQVPDAARRVRLVLVGEGPDEEALQRLVPPGVDVRFVGARLADRHHFAASADVLCFTPRIASHPMSLLEGLAAGLPVVCQDIEGARELVRHGTEGLLVPLGDVSAYAAALRRLIGDAALRRRLGQAALLRARPFDWQRIAGQTEAFYQRVLERRRQVQGSPGPGEAEEARQPLQPSRDLTAPGSGPGPGAGNLE